MSSIRCPHCDFKIDLQGVKTGRFTPRCPSCQRQFVLMIAHGADGTLVEHAIPSGAASVGGTTSSESVATQAPTTNNAAASRAGMTIVSQSAAAIHARTASEPTHAIAKAEASARFSSRLESTPLQRTRLGGYEIRRRLGQGGMGAVYLARQISLDRNVALNVLSPRLAADPNFVARFTREAYAAAQLRALLMLIDRHSRSVRSNLGGRLG
jgi:hypothetical protein